MTITFLGTSAATACPLPFCQCKHCEQARVLGGPSLRKRSAALINADLLIDLGPDIIAASFIHGCSITNIRYCLQTHPHSDHLDLSHLLTRSPEYAVEDVPRLGFYASSATLHKAAELLKNECAKASLLDPVFCDHLNMDIHPIEAYQSFVVGPYRVIAFPANHDPTVDPLLYAIEADGQTVFYGTDTAILPEETWQGFHKHHLRFDVVILDHTYGIDIPASDHLNAEQFIEHIARMRKEKLLTNHARILATHISHEGNPSHPELSDFAARHGYEIAYDGLTI